MADEADTPENGDEILELTDAVEPDEAPEVENPEEEEEEVFAFGEEPDPETETPTIKHMRAELAKAHRELAEARKASAPKEQPIEVGPKPTLAEYEYDEELFDKARDEWEERKAAAQRQAAGQTESQEAERKAWQAELDKVNEEKAALGRPDSEAAFETVREALTTAQQALLVQTVDPGNRAKLIYALAKNPAQLQQLAGLNVTDAITVAKFAKAVTKLEGQLKMVKRRKAPDPDVPQKGSAPTSTTSSEKKLKKLEEEADRTGDRTALIQYRKSLTRGR